MAIFYECQRCTACCRWPGNVRVSNAEITALAKFKGLSEFDFIQKYTRLHTDKRSLSLIEKENHECIFLDGINCTVQPVKPQQCKDFPNKWNFPGWRDVCQAIPREIPD